MKSVMLFLAMAGAIFLGGCNTNSPSGGGASDKDSMVFISLTSDALENPQSVDMAMKLAGFSIAEDREVFMFFNVKGVTLPVAEFPDDFAFGEESPIKAQLIALIEKGAKVHVCPICMKALGVEASDLIEGAEVTTREGLFEHIGSTTSVFTY